MGGRSNWRAFDLCIDKIQPDAALTRSARLPTILTIGCTFITLQMSFSACQTTCPDPLGPRLSGLSRWGCAGGRWCRHCCLVHAAALKSACSGLLDLYPFHGSYRCISATGSSKYGRVVSDDRAREDVRRRIRILIVRLGVEVGKIEVGLRKIRSIERSQNGKLLRLSRRCGLLARFCSRLIYSKMLI
jgi:hypothetical protein